MNLNTETTRDYLLLAAKSLERDGTGEALVWIDEAQSLLLREPKQPVELILNLEKKEAA